MPLKHNPSHPEMSGFCNGLSAVEIAAKRGLGPMSPAGAEVWHGHARPCPSCGNLVRRSDTTCEHCGQHLTPEMLARMQAHAGPWYVHEHVRPFPGVTLDRLIRQARRGVLGPTTIVRGPTTYHQWRFAAETPGLSKHLGKCWNCQAEVNESDTYCDTCDSHLDRLPGEFPAKPPAQLSTGTSELDRLNMAIQSSPAASSRDARERASRRIPVPLVIAGILLLTVVSLIAFVRIRENARIEVPLGNTPFADKNLDDKPAKAGS